MDPVAVWVPAKTQVPEGPAAAGNGREGHHGAEWSEERLWRVGGIWRMGEIFTVVLDRMQTLGLCGILRRYTSAWICEFWRASWGKWTLHWALQKNLKRTELEEKREESFTLLLESLCILLLYSGYIYNTLQSTSCFFSSYFFLFLPFLSTLPKSSQGMDLNRSRF